jgi:heptosyltransferase-2
VRILIIQTAFIGDVIIATSLVEKLKVSFPETHIDFLVRKGNETLLENNPHIENILVWDKKNSKLNNLFSLLFSVRKNKYDTIINCHRFASSGFITAFSGAKTKIGFSKNPFSFLFTKRKEHNIGNNIHETERLNELISDFTEGKSAMPKLYPSHKDYESVKVYKKENYICLAPTSVWFTKQLPFEKWKTIIEHSNETIYLLGSASDFDFCEKLKSIYPQKSIYNLSGRLSFLQSAALMKDAIMNYVNDSAPLHIASSVNAPVTAFFCSTTPAFGFGPLSEKNFVIETREKLDCRPCGLHGYKSCPLGHFKCGTGIEIS